VMLLPQLDVGRSANSEMAATGVMLGLVGALFGGGSAIQTRALTKSEATSSIVLYFSLICTLAGLATWPFGWVVPDWPELTALIVIGICGGLAHIPFSESYRLPPPPPDSPLRLTPRACVVGGR